MTEVLAGLTVSAVQEVPVHQDLRVIEANRHFGNLDPRFGTPLDVVRNRIALAGKLGCDRMVAMVPYAGDHFTDVDRGTVEVPADGYRIWPAELQMARYRYDSQAPPYMADLPGDGLITSTPKVGLNLNPADCAPVVMYDPKHRALSLVHVGRGGAITDIAPQMLDYMRRRFHTNPADLVTYFGPATGIRSHVIEELRGILRGRDWAPFITDLEANDLGTGYGIDFVGYTASRLIQAGVRLRNITYSEVDVVRDENYFSYERHQATKEPSGRNGFMVMIRPEAA